METSSGLPRKCSAIFGHLRKFSEILGKCLGTFVWSSGQFEKSSEIFGRWSEILGKSSETPSSVCLYNKKNITRQLEDMNFIFSWQQQYLTRSLSSLVRYCSCHSNIKFISSRHRVIFSMYAMERAERSKFSQKMSKETTLAINHATRVAIRKSS